MQAEGTALVTGAGRGLGRAVALELAYQGFDVLATMRDPRAGASLPEEAVAAAAKGTISVRALDVARPETIVVPEQLRVLVNNAAVKTTHPPFEATPLSMWRDLFEVNVFGVVEMTRRAIPAMRAAGDGVICNLTSSAVLSPSPFYAPYRAGKAAVSAMSESLRTELAPFGIRVLEIVPGPIATDMLASGTGHSLAAADWPEYAAMARRSGERRRAMEAAATSPADAAHAIVDAILDDDSPFLRMGCDPSSVAMLEEWRATPHEAFMNQRRTTWSDVGAPDLA